MQPIARLLRPVALVEAHGSDERFLVEITAVVRIEDATTSEQTDMLFGTRYSDVYPGAPGHPFVPAYPYVYMTGEYILLPTASVRLRPCLLVPDVDPKHRLRQPRGSTRFASDTDLYDHVERPRFFWMKGMY